MPDSASKTVLCFTAGKDSTLSLTLLLQSRSPNAKADPLFKPHVDHSVDYNIVRCVAFAPRDKPFRAHPQDIVKAIAQECLGIPFEILYVEGPDMVAAYREHILRMHTDDGASFLATGDMQDVCSAFMDRVVEPTPVKLVRPLWQLDPDLTLRQMLGPYGLTVLVTCVDAHQVEPELCDALLGKVLTWEVYERWLKGQDKVDQCGERGEFHTLVLDSPLHKRRLEIVRGHKVAEPGLRHWWFEVEEWRVVDK
ncbi:adenine nucleotide alpha hydrolases-like protein [Gonapodya prolifera JEL478]|uniref:Diphthine--ammonia ligase n=1 Tax=Gonapodya prolifera (strain JEL478) TaxID=1344416 RepID=A0A139ATM4_GONPJ|nr:adenine nucleotide alpha hydrolases-like protein [Gonapodya prolifera JEL478]|eukprot:KXS19845.1 adenine nucleotide alpha hydrolases-like protein [Gonapodya prolifera JEL478]